MPRFALTVLLAAVVAGATGCAPRERTDLPPEDMVARRAEARWQAMINKDWRAAYDMLTPGFRATTTFEGFRLSMMNRKLDWTAAEVVAVSCESSEACVATVKIDYSLIGGMPGVREVSSSVAQQEAWLKVDGGWYQLPDRGR